MEESRSLIIEKILREVRLRITAVEFIRNRIRPRRNVIEEDYILDVMKSKTLIEYNYRINKTLYWFLDDEFYQQIRRENPELEQQPLNSELELFTDKDFE